MNPTLNNDTLIAFLLDTIPRTEDVLHAVLQSVLEAVLTGDSFDREAVFWALVDNARAASSPSELLISLSDPMMLALAPPLTAEFAETAFQRITAGSGKQLGRIPTLLLSTLLTGLGNHDAHAATDALGVKMIAAAIKESNVELFRDTVDYCVIQRRRPELLRSSNLPGLVALARPPPAISRHSVWAM